MRLIFIALYLVGFSAFAEPKHVDIDFTIRVEFVRKGDRFEIFECHKAKCLPLKSMASISIEEAKVLWAKVKGTVNEVVSQIFTDVTTKADSAKIILGSIDKGKSTAIMNLKADETLKAVIDKQNGSKKRDVYVFQKACGDPECRSFTNIPEGFRNSIKEVQSTFR